MASSQHNFSPKRQNPIIFEPFRIKSVEPIRMTTVAQRAAWVKEAHGNLFHVPADHVMFDLLTDSGTGSLSADQWSAMMQADESYAAARSWFRFRNAVRDVFGLEHVIPTHQGRAAEHLLFKVLLTQYAKQHQHIYNMSIHDLIVPNNTHFDTTRANIEERQATAVDLPCAESNDLTSDYGFKGNMNLETLATLLETKADYIPFVMMTVTNNAEGGQPVSLANLRAVQQLCQQHHKLFVIDACRFAENAFFIQEREHPEMSIRQIVRAVFELADGVTMSAKKDGMSNMGGFLALRDATLTQTCRTHLVVTEGFPTYGGLSGRDLECIAVGLYEALDSHYLEYRVGSIRYAVQALRERGVPVLTPSGGHAIFLNAAQFCPGMKFPGQAVALELYIRGGIRCCEIGSVMFPRARHELVRLAIPRRVYTQSHIDYIIHMVHEVWKHRSEIPAVRMTYEPPVLRHFGAHFERISAGIDE